MPFSLSDVLNSYYISLDESVPTSSTDVATSRVSIPNFLNILTYTIRKLNEFSPFTQMAVIPVVNGQRQYKLPTDFITEMSVRYRGFPLRKANTADWTFLITAVTSYPWQYDVILPGTTSSNLGTPTGNYYLLVDPAPSESSPGGTPPIFPGFNDPFILITYQARIPTDFSSTNYSSYIFTLPEEYHPVLAELCTAYTIGLEGKTNMFEQVLKKAGATVKSINNAIVMGIAENSPNQIFNNWDTD